MNEKQQIINITNMNEKEIKKAAAGTSPKRQSCDANLWIFA